MCSPSHRNEALPPVTDLIPHSEGMVLLDAVDECDGDRCVCSARICPSSLFVEEGHAPAILTLEHMAQAVAASVGIEHRAHARPIETGFLISIRTMTLSIDYLRVGDSLRIEVERIWSDQHSGQFRGRVIRDGDEIAAAVLTTYMGPLPQLDEVQ